MASGCVACARTDDREAAGHGAAAAGVGCSLIPAQNSPLPGAASRAPLAFSFCSTISRRKSPRETAHLSSHPAAGTLNQRAFRPTGHASSLGIETTCHDDRRRDRRRRACGGAAKICPARSSSQIAAHAAYGGVVPEIAARAHVEAIDRIVARRCRAPGSRPRRSMRSRRRPGRDWLAASWSV